jgi:hypothetical protein
LVSYIEDQAHGDDRGHEHGKGGDDKRHECQRVIRLPQQNGGDHDGRGNGQADAQPDVSGRRQRGQQASGEVGGERG